MNSCGAFELAKSNMQCKLSSKKPKNRRHNLTDTNANVALQFNRNSDSAESDERRAR